MVFAAGLGVVCTGLLLVVPATRQFRVNPNLAGVDFFYAPSAERGLRPVKPTVG
jgi:hypothetical protein